MVFLDADKSEYREYLRLVEPKLLRGSVVRAHFRNSGRYESEYIACGSDGLEVSVKK